MLNKDSIMTSASLALELAAKGLTVVPKPNTVVAELVRYTNTPVIDVFASSIDVPEGVNELEQYAAITEGATGGQLDNPSEHDKYFDAVINDIATAVKSHVSFAKNVVKPIVLDFATGVADYMTNFKPPEASSNFCVCVCDVPELLDDESFVDMLRFYEGKAVIAPDLVPAFNGRTNEELLQLLLMGDADADEAITAWYSRKGPEFFQHIWASYFQNREGNGYTGFTTYSEMLALDHFERADYALAMYLFVTKLFDSVPEDSATGQNLNSYQNVLAQTRDFAGSVLTDFLRKVEAFTKAKTLVVSFDLEEKGARVFGPVYREWLESGGTPEIIMGLVVSGKRFTLRSLIDEAHEELVDKWKHYAMFHNAAESNKYFDYFKDALRLKFRELMGNISKEEEVFANNSQEYQGKVTQLFENELASLRSSEIDDIQSLALKLICRSRFYYTDAELILNDIVEASRINPDIDVREAALIATMNYVMDYIADQMSVVADQ